ncbi:hypothetical protein [Paraburkholderia sp. EG304]|uniref:hypothetical protein n=1 Tax=Paraburkholderia sp. EG304 TaxID=3237015 RepID=UPI00397D8FB1
MDTIEGRWILYRERCIPYDLSPAVVYAMKVAFYAGFKTMLDFNFELADLREPVAIFSLELLHREARVFSESLTN